PRGEPFEGQVDPERALVLQPRPGRRHRVEAVLAQRRTVSQVGRIRQHLGDERTQPPGQALPRRRDSVHYGSPAARSPADTVAAPPPPALLKAEQTPGT